MNCWLNTFVINLISAKCLDAYIQARLGAWPQEIDLGDQRLRDIKSIVDRMFEQCFRDRQFKQALGVALETRRMDM